MRIRKYESRDCARIVRLFYETVHTVNAAHYSPEQLNAWAPRIPEEADWDRSFRSHFTLVAEEDGTVLGFGDISAEGYLDRLYVSKDHQREGIATAICAALEEAVSAARVTTHASITAKPFFEKRGYTVIREQQVIRQGVALTNYVMTKQLAQNHGT